MKLGTALLVVGILAIGASAAVAQSQFPTFFTKFKLERSSSSRLWPPRLEAASHRARACSSTRTRARSTRPRASAKLWATPGSPAA